MSIRPTLESLLALLAQHPTAENQAGLKPVFKKFHLAAEALQIQLETAALENSAEYAKLAGLLADPAKRAIVTLDWINAHLKKLKQAKIEGKSLTAAGKKQALRSIIKSGKAAEIITELSETEDDKWRKVFAQIAKLPEKKAAAELEDKIRRDKFERFCLANAVAPIKKGPKGKQILDRKETVSRVLTALAEFKERQKIIESMHA